MFPDVPCGRIIEPRFRRFGHQARVWDVCCWQSKIVTCSEDCSFKVWDSLNRDLISSTQVGHAFGCLFIKVFSRLILEEAFGVVVSPLMERLSRVEQMHRFSCGLECSSEARVVWVSAWQRPKKERQMSHLGRKLCTWGCHLYQPQQISFGASVSVVVVWTLCTCSRIKAS